MSQLGVGSSGLLIDAEVKRIFSSFNLMNHQYLPVEVVKAHLN